MAQQAAAVAAVASVLVVEEDGHQEAVLHQTALGRLAAVADLGIRVVPTDSASEVDPAFVLVAHAGETGPCEVAVDHNQVDTVVPAAAEAALAAAAEDVPAVAVDSPVAGVGNLAAVDAVRAVADSLVAEGTQEVHGRQDQAGHCSDPLPKVRKAIVARDRKIQRRIR